MEELREITFVSDVEWPGMIHGYQTSLALIEQGVPIVTGHMSLMNRAREHYDRITILSGGTRVVLERHDGAWDANGAADEVPDDLYASWMCGGFHGESVEMPRTETPVELIGTPQELEYLVHRQFALERAVVMGWNSEMVGDRLEPAETQEAALDAFDRTLWSVTLRQTDRLAPSKARDALMGVTTATSALFEAADIIAKKAHEDA